ncbi:MAG TPA: DUF6049 family protein [Acidimicrobiales bacterium]
MSTRRSRTALCTLAVAVAALVSTLGTGGANAAEHARAGGPPLVLSQQTPWVTADQPWFNLVAGVSPSVGAASSLSVSISYYGRLVDGSDLQQAMSGTPSGTPLLREPPIPVSEGASGLAAASCVTVVPNASASVPATGDGICAAGSHTMTLDCQPLDDDCQGVYPVSVALVRQGSSTPVARFTTFLTYQQPNAESTTGGPLRVAVVLPVTVGGLTTVADALTDHDVPTTLAVSPLTVSAVDATHARDGTRALEQLAALSSDEVIAQPYVPINLAALTEAGLSSEVGAQFSRGDDLLRAAGLKPVAGAWVDTSSTLSAGDAGNLASGLQLAGATQAVVSNSDLASAGLSNYTFAQPFTLDLAHGSTIPAAAADSSLSTRFTATPNDPVLGAEQLLAGLSFVHFEDTFLRQPRGVVVVPPANWHPSTAFMDALLGGLTPANTALKAVTLGDLFAQLPAGGNREPAVRQLQSGAANHGITSSAAGRIAVDRQQLSSFTSAVDGHPTNLTTLGDTLLTTEAKGLSNAGRSSALNAYAKSFGGTTGQVTLGTERTVTFTSQRAAIPVTVLSSAPYPVTVVVTLSSDKFTFPDGNTQRLTLVHPTTSVRVTAQARTSGDRLPIEVTLHTPDGQVLIAHTVLTVHSTEISFVGVALTVLAGAVLLFWWVRTWRRSRRARPRAH